MSSVPENQLFRLFVLGWMSLTGVIIFFLMGLEFLGLSQDAVADLMCVIPIILLGLLIYAYVKGKNQLLRRLCYGYMTVGIPCILLMFIAPMFIT
ncbi:MAG: hypothetical protein SFW07_04485 [Gammaproteobacteria bacterium]|nr:hypothetical protein [Gammaproteobacteria bacterium]